MMKDGRNGMKEREKGRMSCHTKRNLPPRLIRDSFKNGHLQASEGVHAVGVESSASPIPRKSGNFFRPLLHSSLVLHRPPTVRSQRVPESILRARNRGRETAYGLYRTLISPPGTRMFRPYTSDAWVHPPQMSVSLKSFSSPLRLRAGEGEDWLFSCFPST